MFSFPFSEVVIDTKRLIASSPTVPTVILRFWVTRLGINGLHDRFAETLVPVHAFAVIQVISPNLITIFGYDADISISCLNLVNEYLLNDIDIVISTGPPLPLLDNA